MPCAFHYLGCQVLWRSAERVSHFVLSDLKLAEAEVCQLDVALVVEDDVLRLQVAVNDAVAMEAS